MSGNTKRSEKSRDHVGSSGCSELACFLRWTLCGADFNGSGDAFHPKVEVRCRECGDSFVKYAYEKTIRCIACRGNLRKASEKVEQ